MACSKEFTAEEKAVYHLDHAEAMCDGPDVYARLSMGTAVIAESPPR